MYRFETRKRGQRRQWLPYILAYVTSSGAQNAGIRAGKANEEVQNITGLEARSLDNQSMYRLEKCAMVSTRLKT